MKVLVKNALILSKDSVFHKMKKDLLIVDGKIVAIEDSLEEAVDLKIASKGLTITIGWFDLGCKLYDPGFEFKEDLASASNAASIGGFTGLACFPNTKPIIQSKENIHYILSKSQLLPVDVHVIAAATENLEGKAMTEIFDLHHAGAAAFTDGGFSIPSSGLMVRLLQYLHQIDALLIVHAEESSLTSSGVMNEGEMSVYLGLKGMPSIAEELIVERNLKLLEYTGGKIHFHKISTAGSVRLIKEAKTRGLNVTCGVAIANLVYDESHLIGFDSSFKTNPPLRNKVDQDCLWTGLKENTIDVVITDHDPQDEESKKLELDHAEFGMTQFETAFGVLNKYYKGRIELTDLLEKLSKNPRRLLKHEIPKVEVGAVANLTIFDTDEEWVYEEKNVKSKSKNSPELGNTLKGKVKAVISKGQIQYFG